MNSTILRVNKDGFPIPYVYHLDSGWRVALPFFDTRVVLGPFSSWEHAMEVVASWWSRVG